MRTPLSLLMRTGDSSFRMLWKSLRSVRPSGGRNAYKASAGRMLFADVTRMRPTVLRMNAMLSELEEPAAFARTIRYRLSSVDSDSC